MSKSLARVLALIVCLFSITSQAVAEVRIANIFADHMVLQRDKPLRIWGWADPGDQVQIEFAGQVATATADQNGAWEVTLQPLAASAEGRPLRVASGDKTIVVNDVLVGEVWHASGQSNMAMNVGAMTAELESVKVDIAAADLPALRFCRINEGESKAPQSDLSRPASWTVCTPTTVPGFSGAAFYFARRLNHELGVPIGIIDSSRGGTPIEPFIPRAAFTSHPTLQRELELGDAEDLAAIWRLKGGVQARDANWLPGRLFNSRMAPITRLAARGAIWYQGESNSGVQEDPRDYQFKMQALISGWRAALENETLPVYFAQLPGSGAGAGWPYLREQQRLAADFPNSGLVVTIDLDGPGIHPANKVDVGQRLARWALAKDYGKQIAFSGPLFDRQEIQGNDIVLHFRYAESGLMTADKEGLAQPQETPEAKLSHFEVTDKAGQWRPAHAKIEGETVVVHSPDVAAPIAVRYAYAVTPENCNLYNRDGLPAAPFCSQPQLLVYDPNLPQ
ncbi:sialate O-acetylesterase [Blastopirellula sp. JC732]|uniref:Sialate O-acetylesterase n=1 Tax=Blastopirellula sediminis TaxID=2894196 RepID=A0A9X1SGE6_9BACT|nr:sialate O-acetylesterase [Blastopirellula sediminis]MCC9608321.1 sialate O-acetylesterase [Blastopirellula sediminis]MCC9628902.1 sialate O-acetylesterase [Blastopirellula sediminis]